MDCHFLLQGTLPTQESKPGLPHCRQTLYRLSHQGSLIYEDHVYEEFRVVRLIKTEAVAAGPRAEGGPGRQRSRGSVPLGVLQEGTPSAGGGVNALNATELGTQNGQDGTVKVTCILHNTERKQKKNPPC